MPHHFLGVVLFTNILYMITNYVATVVGTFALACSLPEGSLQTSDQSRRPKQCLFWYLIPEAPDQKWREAPLSSSQINI